MDLIEENIGQISILRNRITRPRLCLIETHGEIVGNKQDVAKNSHGLIDFCNKNDLLYIAYNPSNNGTQEDQKVAEVRFSKRVADLKELISNVESKYHRAAILLGSSLGGLISINAAASTNVRGLIINCGVIQPEETFKVLAGNDLDNWKQKGSLNLLGVDLPYSFCEDLLSLNTDQNLHSIKIPILWFHGTKDELAPIKFVQEAAEGNSNIKLVEVKDGGHRFGEMMQPGQWENTVEQFILSLMSS